MARGLHVRLIDNLDLMDNLCFSHVGTRDSSLFLFDRLLRFPFFLFGFRCLGWRRVDVALPGEGGKSGGKKREATVQPLAGSDNENKKLLFS